MKINVCCDSSCDLPKGYAENNGIKTLYIPVIIKGEEHLNVDNNMLFDSVKETGELPKTAAPSKDDFVKFFGQYPKDEKVIMFTLSSELSSLYSHAKEAEQEFDNVTVIDSQNLSSGIALQVLACVDDVNDGMSFDDVVKRALDRVKKANATFVIDTLKYLHKSGRCSTLKLLGANLLKIKPEISVIDGKMTMTKKYKGKINNVIKDYASDKMSISDTNKKYIFITHTMQDDSILDEITRVCREHGYENVYETTASSTIAVHCGENTLGLLFLQN